MLGLPLWAAVHSGGYHQLTHVFYLWFPIVLVIVVGLLMRRPEHSARLVLGAFALYLLGFVVAQVVLLFTNSGSLG